MKTNQNIFKAIASVALAFGAFASAQAQSNLGVDCGCPSVSSRTEVIVSTLPGYLAINGTYGGELTQGANFTCDKTYILDKKIYIPANQTLTIAPGTVIKGRANLVTAPAEATALIIERGGKILALGTESCPIVFTAEADPMNGTYPIYNVGKWGGVVILGKASNNLTLAANGPFVPGGAGKLAVADGLGTVEGFASSNPQDQYGVATAVPSNVTSNAPTPPTGNYTFGIGLNTGVNAGFNISGNTKIKLSSSSLAAYVFVGMPVSGTGIAVGTTVTAVSSADITLSNALTADASGAYVFTGSYPAANPLTPNFYTVGSAPAFVDPATNGYGPFNIQGGLINFAAPFAGAAQASFDDNDNSGIMKYVSIRHSGAILAVGAEINGLTLASVGRGTTIDHIEIVSCADDNIEIFGGTVNLKYVSTLFGNDDMLDYDLGWKGKCQFFFGMKNTGPNATTGLGSPDNDNGIEADSDDNTSNSTIKSTPVMYNMTFIGNGKSAGTSDNRGLSGANFKEGAQGELYNSVFANFKNGVNLQVQSGTRVGDGYEYWNAGTLKIKCNSFVGIGSTTTPAIENNYLVKNASSQAANGIAPSGADTTKFLVTDLNTAYFNRASSAFAEPTAIPGFSYAFTVSATNAVTVKNDVTPNPVLSTAGCPVAPVDGFFEPAAYRGAFSSTPGDNWLSNWTYSQVLNATSGISACPTDLNSDGQTDVNDFLIFAPAFGTSCN